MRRALLLSTLSAAGLGALGSVAASPTTGGRKTDRRLLGAWRSDKEKTTALWKYTKEISDENRQKFEAIFGKLTWRITARRWEAEYEDQKWGSPYSVVAADKKSVVISHPGEPGEQPELKQYFFEGEYMYVVAGNNIEFFKRIEA